MLLPLVLTATPCCTSSKTGREAPDSELTPRERERLIAQTKRMAAIENNDAFIRSGGKKEIRIKNSAAGTTVGIHLLEHQKLPSFRCTFRKKTNEIHYCETVQPFCGKACVKRRYIDNVTGEWQSLGCQGVFSMALPPDIRYELAFGIDSCVATYTSPGIEVRVDFGQYSNRSSYCKGEPHYREEHWTLSGKEVKIITCSPDTREKPYQRRHIAGAFLMISNGSALLVATHCKTAADQRVALEMLGTIRFHPTTRR